MITLFGLYHILSRFLKILELIVVEPGSAFKAFLPQVISICMEQIYPIISPVSFRGLFFIFDFFVSFLMVLVCKCNHQRQSMTCNCAEGR